jgi:hypothetical protein
VGSPDRLDFELVDGRLEVARLADVRALVPLVAAFLADFLAAATDFFAVPRACATAFPRLDDPRLAAPRLTGAVRLAVAVLVAGMQYRYPKPPQLNRSVRQPRWARARLRACRRIPASRSRPLAVKVRRHQNDPRRSTTGVVTPSSRDAGAHCESLEATEHRWQPQLDVQGTKSVARHMHVYQGLMVHAVAHRWHDQLVDVVWRSGLRRIVFQFDDIRDAFHHATTLARWQTEATVRRANLLTGAGPGEQQAVWPAGAATARGIRRIAR